jgi:hypothetical protein
VKIDLVGHPARRAVTKKYQSDGKGRRSRDTSL